MEITFSQWILTGFSVILFPVLILYIVIIVVALLGRSSGLTKLYTKILIFLFEWGKKRIKNYEENKLNFEDNFHYEDVSEEEEEEEEEEKEEKIINKKSTKSQTTTTKDQQQQQQIKQKKNIISSRDQLLKHLQHRQSFEQLERKFSLEEIMYLCKNGVKVIVEDEVTQRFSAADLSSWNFLTRTNNYHQFISWRISILWGLGCVLRIGILFPFRALLALLSVIALFVGTALVGRIKNIKRRRKLNKLLSLSCYRMISRSFSSSITFHNRENKAKEGGICVANHTSPIDIIVLGCDNCYAMVGQKQGGLFGFIQNAMIRSEEHIWFQRSEVKDRSSVARRLRGHVEDGKLLPILIFPEGTCINNTSIMMFKKGCFEVGGVIYPVAIKYDSRFADPFWNSSKETLTRHLINIFTSWALVCDVWYLPPQKLMPGESTLNFTNRVKSLIANQGGLVDLEWDGQLKREKPKPSLLEKQQNEFFKRINSEKKE